MKARTPNEAPVASSSAHGASSEDEEEEEELNLAGALRAAREKRRWTQEEMAEHLGMSRKPYVLFETWRWLPPPRERAHFLKRLHDVSPRAARALADALNVALEDHVIVTSTTAAAAAALDAKQAKMAFDSALYTTAEEVELNPKAMRAIAALLLERVKDSGLTLEQAAALAKAASAAKK